MTEIGLVISTKHQLPQRVEGQAASLSVPGVVSGESSQT